MRVALVQLTSTDNLSENLDSVRRAVSEAAEGGAEFIALPENFAFLRREGNPIPCAQGLDGEIVETVRELASRHRVPILAGTFAEAIEGDERVYNTSALISETGQIADVYLNKNPIEVNMG
jgi:predicted amidohydrolase